MSDRIIANQSNVSGVASRRGFLRNSAVMTLAGTSSAILLGGASARAVDTVAKMEKRELNAANNKKGSQKDEFISIRQHENDHVAFLVMALGASARPKPNFQGLLQKKFGDFITIAQILENTGVGAYLGAAPALNSAQYLAAAGSILTIEARHSGYLNEYLGDPLTGNAADINANPSFEMPLTADQVVAGASAFIKDLNGGPPLTYSTTPSDVNDIDILNFALALEYLEAEFYNLNVPVFYKGT